MVLSHACLILSAFCPNIHSRPFDQILWILLILFIYHSLSCLSDLIVLLTRIHGPLSFFLLSKIIWLKIRVLIINLFQLYAHDILTKTYDPLFLCFFLKSSKISFFHWHTTVQPHSSHVTESRIFKNLNLRKKADRNFRGTFLKNRFRHLNLYSNPPSWLATSHCHTDTFWKTKDWSWDFWERQPVLVRGNSAPKKT